MSDQSVNDLPSLAIRRPILIFVANLLIVIAGIAAIFGIEVRELPDVDRPVVSVNANYPGASPETMDAEVTSIVEGAVARVSGVLEIRSSSEENNSRIRIEFSPSTNLDIAASDVREAVNRVERELPDDVEQLTVVKADSDAEPVVSLAVYSGQLDEDELTRVVENDLSPRTLIIHRFRPDMVTNTDSIVSREGVRIIFHADGEGGPAAKIADYDTLMPPRFARGIKIFYDEDVNRMTPEEVLARLDPTPTFVSYQ